MGQLMQRDKNIRSRSRILPLKNQTRTLFHESSNYKRESHNRVNYIYNSFRDIFIKFATEPEAMIAQNKLQIMLASCIHEGFKIKVTRQLESIIEKRCDSENNYSAHGSSKNNGSDSKSDENTANVIKSIYKITSEDDEDD